MRIRLIRCERTVMFFNQKKKKNISQLSELLGAACELLTPDNKMVFIGKLQDTDGDSVTIVPASSGEMPPIIYNSEFKLRIHRPSQAPLTLVGFVCGSGRSFWKLDRFFNLGAVENRDTFRQHTTATATVLCINVLHGREDGYPSHRATPCHLVDISVGGLQFQSTQQFATGDWLAVMNVELAENDRPFLFSCQVQWAREAAVAKLGWNYGCRFIPAPFPTEEERLFSAIFSLQRKEIYEHRAKLS